jgi:hypothetical protein
LCVFILQTHRRVSLVKHNKFARWLDNSDWRMELDKPENINLEDDCQDWMLGKGPEISHLTTTTLIRVKKHSK